MHISSLYIGQKFIGLDKKEHIISCIHENGTIITKDNKTYHCNNIKPLKGQEYIEADLGDHKCLCIETNNGTLIADIDHPDDDCYTAMYLSFQPKGQETAIDLASIQTDKSHDITLKAYTDVTKEYATHEFQIKKEDILNSLT